MKYAYPVKLKKYMKLTNFSFIYCAVCGYCFNDTYSDPVVCSDCMEKAFQAKKNKIKKEIK